MYHWECCLAKDPRFLLTFPPSLGPASFFVSSFDPTPLQALETACNSALPLVVSLTHYRLLDPPQHCIINSLTRGIRARIGTPPHDIAMLPWPVLKNTYIQGKEVYCDLSIMTRFARSAGDVTFSKLSPPALPNPSTSLLQGRLAAWRSTFAGPNLA